MILQSNDPADLEHVVAQGFQLFTITDEQRAFLMIGMLVLIMLYFIIVQIPVKKKDVWNNVRNRNRKKAKKAGEDDQRKETK